MQDKSVKKQEAAPQMSKAEMTAPIQTDPQGSYTGRPKIPYETPVQDADDL